MSGDDWDASDDEVAAPARVVPVAAPRKSKFADEDAEDEPEVKDDWEASDDEQPSKPAAPTGPAPPVRQKGITKAKIAEKEAAERAKLEAAQARAGEDPHARKAREMKMQVAQDLENARSLFGGASLEEVVGGSEHALSQYPNPKTKQDFEALAEALSKQIIDLHGDKPLYAHFAEQLIRALALPLKDLDVKKCASTLTAVANEKQQAAKAGTGKKGGKGGKKPQLGVVGGTGGGAKTAVVGRGYSADLEMHDTALDDYDDDFM